MPIWLSITLWVAAGLILRAVCAETYKVKAELAEQEADIFKLKEQVKLLTDDQDVKGE